jgi:cytochrome c-type biogenesis protein CcmH/NrfG
MDPRNKDAWYYLDARTTMNTRLRQARQAFEKVLELAPRSEAENNRA